jgi:hypothetical protein
VSISGWASSPSASGSLPPETFTDGSASPRPA